MPGREDGSSLADLLERILDKGIVIAGDISISLVDVELLTIKLRLLVASVDKAKEMGVTWWETDPWLSGRAAEQGGGSEGSLAGRIDRLEATLERLERALPAPAEAAERGGGRK
ncbi:MAG TPA: gas vesicle protein [Acidimicrobiales bacterium]|nr:gas vesicle protein [Acidimicrobiales bacterium]